MLVGHFAAGLLAKRAAPQASLGTFVLAAVAADLLWCLFLLVGIEHVAVQPGSTTQNSLHAIEIGYSHGLATDLLWATIFAGIWFWRRRSARSAAFLFAAVLSHWLFDFISHAPDMPLAPGVHHVFGLGLWNSIPATLVVEGGLWLVAIVLYARVAPPQSRSGRYAFWIGIAILTAAWWNNVAGPPPQPNVSALAATSLVFFATGVIWAYWVNRLRPARA